MRGNARLTLQSSGVIAKYNTWSGLRLKLTASNSGIKDLANNSLTADATGTTAFDTAAPRQ